MPRTPRNPVETEDSDRAKNPRPRRLVRPFVLTAAAIALLVVLVVSITHPLGTGDDGHKVAISFTEIAQDLRAFARRAIAAIEVVTPEGCIDVAEPYIGNPMADKLRQIGWPLWLVWWAVVLLLLWIWLPLLVKGLLLVLRLALWLPQYFPVVGSRVKRWRDALRSDYYSGPLHIWKLWRKRELLIGLLGTRRVGKSSFIVMLEKYLANLVPEGASLIVHDVDKETFREIEKEVRHCRSTLKERRIRLRLTWPFAHHGSTRPGTMDKNLVLSDFPGEWAARNADPNERKQLLEYLRVVDALFVVIDPTELEEHVGEERIFDQRAAINNIMFDPKGLALGKRFRRALTVIIAKRDAISQEMLKNAAERLDVKINDEFNQMAELARRPNRLTADESRRVGEWLLELFFPNLLAQLRTPLRQQRGVVDEPKRFGWLWRRSQPQINVFAISQLGADVGQLVIEHRKKMQEWEAMGEPAGEEPQIELPLESIPDCQLDLHHPFQWAFDRIPQGWLHQANVVGWRSWLWGRIYRQSAYYRFSRCPAVKRDRRVTWTRRLGLAATVVTLALLSQPFMALLERNRDRYQAEQFLARAPETDSTVAELRDILKLCRELPTKPYRVELEDFEDLLHAKDELDQAFERLQQADRIPDTATQECLTWLRTCARLPAESGGWPRPLREFRERLMRPRPRVLDDMLEAVEQHTNQLIHEARLDEATHQVTKYTSELVTLGPVEDVDRWLKRLKGLQDDVNNARCQEELLAIKERISGLKAETPPGYGTAIGLVDEFQKKYLSRKHETTKLRADLVKEYFAYAESVVKQSIESKDFVGADSVLLAFSRVTGPNPFRPEALSLQEAVNDARLEETVRNLNTKIDEFVANTPPRYGEAIGLVDEFVRQKTARNHEVAKRRADLVVDYWAYTESAVNEKIEKKNFTGADSELAAFLRLPEPNPLRSVAQDRQAKIDEAREAENVKILIAKIEALEAEQPPKYKEAIGVADGFLSSNTGGSDEVSKYRESLVHRYWNYTEPLVKQAIENNDIPHADELLAAFLRVPEPNSRRSEAQGIRDSLPDVQVAKAAELAGKDLENGDFEEAWGKLAEVKNLFEMARAQTVSDWYSTAVQVREGQEQWRDAVSLLKEVRSELWVGEVRSRVWRSWMAEVDTQVSAHLEKVEIDQANAAVEQIRVEIALGAPEEAGQWMEATDVRIAETDFRNKLAAASATASAATQETLDQVVSLRQDLEDIRDPSLAAEWRDLLVSCHRKLETPRDAICIIEEEHQRPGVKLEVSINLIDDLWNEQALLVEHRVQSHIDAEEYSDAWTALCEACMDTLGSTHYSDRMHNYGQRQESERIKKVQAEVRDHLERQNQEDARKRLAALRKEFEACALDARLHPGEELDRIDSQITAWELNNRIAVVARGLEDAEPATSYGEISQIRREIAQATLGLELTDELISRLDLMEDKVLTLWERKDYNDICDALSNLKLDAAAELTNQYTAITCPYVSKKAEERKRAVAKLKGWFDGFERADKYTLTAIHYSGFPDRLSIRDIDPAFRVRISSATGFSDVTGQKDNLSGSGKLTGLNNSIFKWKQGDTVVIDIWDDSVDNRQRLLGKVVLPSTNYSLPMACLKEYPVDVKRGIYAGDADVRNLKIKLEVPKAGDLPHLPRYLSAGS